MGYLLIYPQKTVWITTGSSIGYTSYIRQPHSAQFPNSTTSECLPITVAHLKQKNPAFSSRVFYLHRIRCQPTSIPSYGRSVVSKAILLPRQLLSPVSGKSLQNTNIFSFNIELTARQILWSLPADHQHRRLAVLLRIYLVQLSR